MPNKSATEDLYALASLPPRARESARASFAERINTYSALNRQMYYLLMEDVTPQEVAPAARNGVDNIMAILRDGKKKKKK